MSNVNLPIEELLKGLREKVNISQSDMAKLLKLSNQVQWSLYETGKKPLSLEMTVPISKILKIHPIALTLMLLDRYIFPELPEVWLSKEDLELLISESKEKGKGKAKEALEKYMKYLNP